MHQRSWKPLHGVAHFRCEHRVIGRRLEATGPEHRCDSHSIQAGLLPTAAHVTYGTLIKCFGAPTRSQIWLSWLVLSEHNTPPPVYTMYSYQGI